MKRWKFSVKTQASKINVESIDTVKFVQTDSWCAFFYTWKKERLKGPQWKFSWNEVGVDWFENSHSDETNQQSTPFSQSTSFVIILNVFAINFCKHHHHKQPSYHVRFGGGWGYHQEHIFVCRGERVVIAIANIGFWKKFGICWY